MNNKIYCNEESIKFLYKISKCKHEKECIKKIYIQYKYFIKKCIDNKVYNIYIYNILYIYILKHFTIYFFYFI